MMSRATKDDFLPLSYCGLVLLLSILLLVAGCGEDAENEQGPAAPAGQEQGEVIPRWVQAEPESDALRDRFAIHGGWWASYEEARKEYQEALDRRIHAQMDSYLDESAAYEGAHELVLYEPDQFQEFVVISEPYLETREFKVAGLMYQLHSLVEIETDLKKELGSRWQDYEGRHRVGQLALGWLAIAGIIAVLYLHLRTSQADVPRRRRFILTLGLVICLLVLLLLLAQWIQWI
jgi:hypothetical protein